MANGCREDVDTALLKLYAEQNHDSLLDLLASDNACLLADSVPWLEKYHKCVYCQISSFKNEYITHEYTQKNSCISNRETFYILHISRSTVIGIDAQIHLK